MPEQTWYAALGLAACVGLDWAMDKHAVTVKDLDSGQRERCQLGNTPEAVELWAGGLAARFGGRPVAVALEQSRGAVISMLSKYAHLLLFPVHPKALADYRKALHPSGAKDDPTDGDLLEEFLELHGRGLRMWQPDTEATRSLQWLTEERRKFVGDQTRFAQRLRGQLQRYYPQVLQWFDQIGTPLVLAFLRRWPTLEEVKKAKPATLRRFFQQHNCRQQSKIEERIQAIASAVAATLDAAVILSGRLAVATLVDQLEAIHTGIAAYDRQIAEITLAHPDNELMDSFPGAGPAMRPRLIAALGTRRDRYLNAAEIQRCSGIAPLIERSGRQYWVYWCTGVGLARNSYGRRFTNGPLIRLPFPPGRGSTTRLSAIRTKAITLPSGRWPSSGFGFCFAAGKIARLTMKPNTCRHYWPRASQNSLAIFHRT